MDSENFTTTTAGAHSHTLNITNTVTVTETDAGGGIETTVKNICINFYILARAVDL